MGSAIQPQVITVQGKIEEVLKKLNINEKTVFSGRTDKNVHASKQIISVKVPIFWNDTKKLMSALKKMLPSEISILKIRIVPESFHARFSAKKREYRYIISLKRLNPFTSNYFHYEENIEIDTLKNASKLFLGKHDFSLFCKQGSEPKSTIREIYKIDIYSHKSFIIIRFQANAYLRSQIRMMVDFLLKISKKELSIRQLEEQLNNKYHHSKTLAPAQGLYLSKVIY